MVTSICRQTLETKSRDDAMASRERDYQFSQMFEDAMEVRNCKINISAAKIHYVFVCVYKP